MSNTRAVVVDGGKICSACGVWKLLTDFRRGRCVGGRHSKCRACFRSNRRTASPRSSNVSVVDGGKKCTKCNQWKILEEFSAQRLGSGGRAAQCSECESTRKHSDYKKYPSTRLARMKTRAEKNGVGFVLRLEELEALLDVEVCPVWGCGKPFGSLESNNLKSIDRLDSEGPYSKENCACICMKCNSLKNNASPDRLRALADWVQAQIDVRGLNPSEPSVAASPDASEPSVGADPPAELCF